MSYLVLREDVLSELVTWACDDVSQHSVLTVVTGHATTGKTVLLDNLGRRAAARGSQICRLSGMVGGEDAPYALMEQVALPGGGPVMPARPAATAEPGESTRLAAELAERFVGSMRRLTEAGPVLITIDDIQHVDALSLQCLSHVRQRMATDRIKIVCALRNQVDVVHSPELSEFLHQADAGRVELDALTVGQLRTALISTPLTSRTPLSAETLHQESGGNPLLLDLLLTRTRRTSLPAVATGRSSQRGALGRAALTCVHRVGATSARVARGIAVLGDAGDLRMLSMLCEVSMAVAERAVDQLRDIGLLDGRRYRHREAASAIVRDTKASELVRLRVRAASLLGEETATQRAADQLVLAGVVLDERQFALLRAAAERAIADNELRRAARYLDLARRCRPDHRDRHAINTELAYLHWMIDPAGSASRIGSLAPSAVAGRVEPEHAHLAAGMALWHLETDAAAALTDTLRSAGEDNAPLQATRLLLKSISPGVVAELRYPLPSDDHPESPPNQPDNRTRASSSLYATLTGKHSEATRVAVEQTLLTTKLESPFELTAIRCALLSLIYGEWLDSAAHWVGHLTADDRWQSALHCQASGSVYSALIALRRDNHAEAAEHADKSLTLLTDHHNLTACLAYSTYIEACALLGHHREARRVSAKPMPGQLFKTLTGAHYLHARATQQLEAGHLRISLSHFASTGDQMTKWGLDAPSVAPWRLGVAKALLRLDDQDRAGQLMHQQLRVCAGRYPLVELRTRRLLADHDLLGPSELPPAESERRRPPSTGQVIVRIPESRTSAFGDAGALAARSADELSEAEQRVANLAAKGLSNREIGARLFLTVSTVEQHLTKIYRKLRIRNRTELRRRLEAGSGSTSADGRPNRMRMSGPSGHPGAERPLGPAASRGPRSTSDTDRPAKHA